MTDDPRRAPAGERGSAQLSRELLQRAHAVAGLGTYTIDLQRQVIQISAEMAHLYRAGEEAFELPLAEYRRRFYHPDDLAPAVQKADSAYRSHAGLGLEARVVRGDREIIWVRSSSSTELNERGESVVVGVILDVTDLRAAAIKEREQAATLAASEKRYRRLLEGSLTGVYIAQDGRFAYASPSLEKIFGAAPGSLVGTPILAQIHPDDVAIVTEKVRQRTDGEAPTVHYEVRGIKRDGTTIWLEVLGATMEHEGRPALFGNVLDVTARRRAEAELARSELRWRTFIEKAPLAIGFSRDGIGVYANEKFLELWRYQSSADVAGHPVLKHWAPQDRPLIAERVRLRAQGLPTPPDNRIAQRSDGTSFPAHLETISVDTPDGPVTAAFITDETERHRAQEGLRSSEHRFRLLTENSPTGICLIQDGRLVYANAAYATIYGRSQAELIGADPLELVHPEDRALAVETVRRPMAHEVDVVHYSVRGLRKNGEVVLLEVVGIACVIDGRPATLGNVLDVTAQRKLEEQLRQSQKMEAIGLLAGGVAHDFNNILAVILSYSYMLLKDLEADDPMRGDVNEIQAAGNRASQMTRQLLAFSRQQVVQPRVVDLNEVVGGMEKMLRRLIGEAVELTTLPSASPVCVYIDPGQLEQVLMNLCVNARDAMPKGGRLKIDLAARALDGAGATEIGLKAGAYARIAVTDTGTGMDAATQKRIFEPFFTTKPVGQGTGLGLSTVFGIVQQGGGQIQVESALGAGTTFNIWLPVAAGEAAVAPAAGATSELTGTETILLVEDDDAVRKLAKVVLAKAGYNLIEARSPGDALVQSEEHAGAIDLVLTDMVMPLMSGERMVEKLRERRPDLRVAFMSGYPGKVEEQPRTAPTIFIQKPFTPETLLGKVREALGGRSPSAAA